MRHTTPHIGAHVSASGGLWNAIIRAREIGAYGIQIFGASPRSWRAKTPSREELDRYAQVLQEGDSIGPVYLHAAYLVNLASANQEIYMRSIESLVAHLTIARALHAQGLIFHVGSSKGMDHKKALTQEVKGIREVLRRVSGDTQLILENAAGGGEKVGGTLEDITFLFHTIQSSRIKICFDTAHAFEAGMVTEYTPTTTKKLFDAWDTAIGVKNITVIHANDSKTLAHSHHDRHENIGEGYIGKEGFRALAQEKRLWDKNWILEVPGFSDTGPDAKNITILKSYFT